LKKIKVGNRVLILEEEKVKLYYLRRRNENWRTKHRVGKV
jgi:hypothetical protein